MKPQILSTLRSERTAKSAQCCGNRLVAQTGEEFPSGAEWPVRRAIFAREMVRVNLHAFCAFERLGDTPVFGYVLAGRPEVELSFCARQLCYSMICSGCCCVRSRNRNEMVDGSIDASGRGGHARGELAIVCRAVELALGNEKVVCGCQACYSRFCSCQICWCLRVEVFARDVRLLGAVEEAGHGSRVGVPVVPRVCRRSCPIVKSS